MKTFIGISIAVTFFYIVPLTASTGEVQINVGEGRVVGGAAQRDAFLAELEKPCPSIDGKTLKSYATFGKGIMPGNELQKLSITYTRKALTSNPLGPLAIDNDVIYEGQEESKQDGWIDCHYTFDTDSVEMKALVDDIYLTPKLTLRRHISHRMDPSTCPNIALRIFYAQLCKEDTKDNKIEVREPNDLDLATVCQNMGAEIDGGYLKYKAYKEQVVSSEEGEKLQFKHTCKYTWPSKKLRGEYTLNLNGVSAF